jgi:hypothetical protein
VPTADVTGMASTIAKPPNKRPTTVGGIAYVLFRLRYDGLRSSRTESASSPIPADGDGAMVTSSNVQTGR